MLYTTILYSIHLWRCLEEGGGGRGRGEGYNGKQVPCTLIVTFTQTR